MLAIPRLSSSCWEQRKSGLVPLEGSVDRRAGYGKHLRQIADGIIAGGVHAAKLPLLLVRQLRLFAPQFALGASDGQRALEPGLRV